MDELNAVRIDTVGIFERTVENIFEGKNKNDIIATLECFTVRKE